MTGRRLVVVGRRVGNDLHGLQKMIGLVNIFINLIAMFTSAFMHI